MPRHAIGLPFRWMNRSTFRAAHLRRAGEIGHRLEGARCDRDEVGHAPGARLAAVHAEPQRAIGGGRARAECVRRDVGLRAAPGLAIREEARVRRARAGGAGRGLRANEGVVFVDLIDVHRLDVRERGHAARAAAAILDERTLARPGAGAEIRSAAAAAVTAASTAAARAAVSAIDLAPARHRQRGHEEGRNQNNSPIRSRLKHGGQPTNARLSEAREKCAEMSFLDPPGAPVVVGCRIPARGLDRRPRRG